MNTISTSSSPGDSHVNQYGFFVPKDSNLTACFFHFLLVQAHSFSLYIAVVNCQKNGIIIKVNISGRHQVV